MTNVGVYIYFAMIFVTFVIFKVGAWHASKDLYHKDDTDSIIFAILLSILSLIWPVTLFYVLGWIVANMIIKALEKLNLKEKI